MNAIVTNLICAVAQPVAKAGSTSSDWVAPAIVAAIVAAAVSLTTFALTGRRARLDRQRQLFADAFEAVTEYREYPYIVRRRSADERAKERTRISSDLSRVQARLNALQARMLVEAPYVGERYADVVQKTKQVAGGMIRAAWDNEPVSDDASMHAPQYDFSELEQADAQYLRAVGDHLGWIYAPARRKVRKWKAGSTPARR
jgi:hypothetical protein